MVSKADEYRKRAKWFGQRALEAKTRGEKLLFERVQAALLDAANYEGQVNRSSRSESAPHPRPRRERNER